MTKTHHRLATMTWRGVAVIVAMLGFAAFALWLTASTFDASEIKSLVMLGAGFLVREVWPIVRAALHPVGEGIAAGNE